MAMPRTLLVWMDLSSGAPPPQELWPVDGRGSEPPSSCPSASGGQRSREAFSGWGASEERGLQRLPGSLLWS